MDLTFYGGINEIGGNKILVQENETRIFLDFGLSYKRNNEYFEFPMLLPTNLDDLLKTGLIPELKGLYRYHNFKAKYDNTGPTSIIKSSEEREFDAVLLSHAHMDHYGYLGLLRDDIPIYLSAVSKKLIELYSRTGRNKFNEKIQHLLLKEISKKSELEIGDFTVKRYNVDHSILGASAYYIEGEKNIVYTGDFRLHGNKGFQTEEFLKTVEKEDVDYLLCEGTRLGLIKNEEERIVEEKVLSSEKEVKNKCIEIIESEEDLIIYDASQADLERVKILSQVAKETGRKLLIDSKKAFLLLYLNETEKLLEDLPSVDDFKILLNRSKLGANTKICRELTIDCPDFFLERFKIGSRNHEKELLNDNALSENQFIWGPVMRKEVLSNANEYIFYTSNGPLLLLHSKQHKENFSGTYIYGKAEPFNEAMEFSFNRLLKWLKLCNLKLEYAHTSGHCFPEDLKNAIEIINPKTLIPIHTEYPQEFEKIIPRGINLKRVNLNDKLAL